MHQCSALFINVLVLIRAAYLHNNRVRRRTVESINSSCWPAGDDLYEQTSKAKDCYYCVGITAVPQLMIHQCKVMSKYFHHFLISFLLQTLTFNIHVQTYCPSVKIRYEDLINCLVLIFSNLLNDLCVYIGRFSSQYVNGMNDINCKTCGKDFFF